MQNLIIPNQIIYFHFLAEWVTGVYQAWVRDKNLTIYYEGPYGELLVPFLTNSTLSKIKIAGAYVPSRARLADVQIQLTAHLLSYFCDFPDEPCITIIKRRGNRQWVDVSALKRTIKDAVSGFEIVDVFLEDMTIKSQINLMRRTRILIGAHGSGLINAMFMQPNRGVIEISPNSFAWPGYPPLCARASLVHVGLEAAACPEGDSEALPAEIVQFLDGRPLSSAIYSEIDMHPLLGRNKTVGPKLRKIIRDVTYVNIDYCNIAVECKKLLSKQSTAIP